VPDLDGRWRDSRAGGEKVNTASSFAECAGVMGSLKRGWAEDVAERVGENVEFRADDDEAPMGDGNVVEVGVDGGVEREGRPAASADSEADRPSEPRPNRGETGRKGDGRGTTEEYAGLAFSSLESALSRVRLARGSASFVPSKTSASNSSFSPSRSPRPSSSPWASPSSEILGGRVAPTGGTSGSLNVAD